MSSGIGASDRQGLEALAEAVVAEAERRLARAHDRAANRERDQIAAAEAHVAALERAARDLGDARGGAVATAVAHEADAEIARAEAERVQRLEERFLQRVRTRLEALPGTDRYPAALAAWARTAAGRMDRPAEVSTTPRDRTAVYEALLAAGAEDFQVLEERRIGCGFVVRDLDGRTLLDRTPDAIVEERSEALRALLAERLPDRVTRAGGTRPADG